MALCLLGFFLSVPLMSLVHAEQKDKQTGAQLPDLKEDELTAIQNPARASLLVTCEHDFVWA